MTSVIEFKNSPLPYFENYENLKSVDKNNRFNRIALIQPAIPGGNHLPSLGLLYIAAVLKRDGFYKR